ncbi:hypothetical protein EsH8_I_000990 [Colletotrichum jinshuiense]
MAKRDSLTVWLPKEMYGSVEPFADERYIWCPMPFDNSLPVEQTSFIDMGGGDGDNDSRRPARTKPTNRVGGPGPAVEATPMTSAPPAIDVLAGQTYLSSSETESERDFPLRKISQNLSRGRRRPRKTQPAQHKGPGWGEDDGGRSRRSRGFAVHLGLNLDIEVTLKARVFGDLEISAFDEL